ncbi:MAG: hypothetical protein CVU38_21270 [Chloroflexi bacterium HGW-Chloroflexi-1]|nr:MAG: hypothetical protein CVU38_21270 [Chloroflexi bacterium HGW-Chloroflexi-1]
MVLRLWAAGRRSLAVGLVALLALTAVSVLAWLTVSVPQLVQAGVSVLDSGPQPPASALFSRLTLLRNSLDLALDYPFTGLGLAGFRMAYSSYVLLMHVAHTIHSHNLFLNLWIEQGLPGLVIFLWLLAAAIGSGVRSWRTEVGEKRPGAGFRLLAPDCRFAALTTLVVIVLHGLVDDAFYGSRGVLLLFLPFAVMARADMGVGDQGSGIRERKATGERCGNPAPFILTSALAWALAWALALALALALFPPARAAFQANLGAVDQTRAELSVYHWPAWQFQDELRRSAQIDLASAIARYDAALALEPGNATANRRLGQIQLSLGQYAAARRHLEAAYAAAPTQRATRQLLGESYAIAGETEQAAALWRTVDVSQGQLDLRRWWYGYLGEQQRAAWIGEAAERLEVGR